MRTDLIKTQKTFCPINEATIRPKTTNVAPQVAIAPGSIFIAATNRLPKVAFRVCWRSTATARSRTGD